jgi:hypothetical protein
VRRYVITINGCQPRQVARGAVRFEYCVAGAGGFEPPHGGIKNRPAALNSLCFFPNYGFKRLCRNKGLRANSQPCCCRQTWRACVSRTPEPTPRFRTIPRSHFVYRIDIWTGDGKSILEHLAGLENLIVARAAYRAACERWPNARITLRQGARIVEDSRRRQLPVGRI